jgi:repressor LexA
MDRFKSQNYKPKKNLKQKTFGALRMLGLVEAGFPTFVDAEDMDTITLDEWLIGDKNATFMLKVKGESMLDAGIIDGDYVIVERGREPRIGDIVLANVDGGWTLKYYKKEKGQVVLIPANKKFKPIYPNENLEIPAVVVSVVRRYKK